MITGKCEVDLPMLECEGVITSRPALSSRHIESALHFCELSGKIESEYTYETITEEKRKQHFAYCINAVTSVYFCFESYINEFYIDLKFYNKIKNQIITSCKFWEYLCNKTFWNYIIKKDSLTKYHIALELCGKPDLDKKAHFYKRITILNDLRNEIVHSKSRWNNDPYQEHKKILKNLREQNIGTNPFVFGNDCHFPFEFISYSCSKWAVISCLVFIKKFCEKMNNNFLFDDTLRNLSNEMITYD
ncbi:MAG: hypothetical protein R2941_17125 [Desulfobacterales bacterium]